MKIRVGKGSIPKSGGGGPLFLAMKFTSLFLFFGKIQFFIPKSTEGGGGVHRFRNFSKGKTVFFSASLNSIEQ